jgi:hypothetical protein
MKKYLLILFCSFAFGQASNQMVTFTQAQSLGFALNAGQSSVNSNEYLTKAQALAKYNLNAGAMSAYASNQLVPRSVWAAGGDIVRYDLRSHPCGGFNPIEGSNGIMYDDNYNVFTGELYYFIRPSSDIFNSYEWGGNSYVNGLYQGYWGTTISPCNN